MFYMEILKVFGFGVVEFVGGMLLVVIFVDGFEIVKLFEYFVVEVNVMIDKVYDVFLKWCMVFVL